MSWSLSWPSLLFLLDLLSPGAESDVLLAEGCDDHDSERNSPIIDDMEESLVTDSSALLDVGHCELGDFHDPDPEESNRIIRYSSPEHKHTLIISQAV